MRRQVDRNFATCILVSKYSMNCNCIILSLRKYLDVSHVTETNLSTHQTTDAFTWMSFISFRLLMNKSSALNGEPLRTFSLWAPII